jgi:hypothetical protein
VIDREQLVTRHNTRFSALHNEPLSVGNGRFCFTADYTGLQSEPALYPGFPLTTMAEWGWHSYPDAPKSEKGLRLTSYDTFGRGVRYATEHEGQEELFYALRRNAHKVSLARLSFTLDASGLAGGTAVARTLDMYRGVLSSEFIAAGETVNVETFVDPDRDAVYVRAESPLLASGRLGIELSFPYGSHTISGADWTKPDRHTTESVAGDGTAHVTRRLDDLSFSVRADSPGALITAGEHSLSFVWDKPAVWLCVRFDMNSAWFARNYPRGADAAEPFGAAKLRLAEFWRGYWQSGGAIDLSESSDPRAFELERRIVLSQYLTAIQSRGSLPPAETGLTLNSWYGKFNVEMHCWHMAHFALWGRAGVIRPSLAWYKSALPAAREIARSQGYEGARWPKLCDASGYNSPSAIAVLLIWQQPHPIMLAELIRRAGAPPEFTREYAEVIAETANFMVSFARWDGSRYVLGPPYYPSQERFDPRTVLNAGFEVEYFRWGLRKAAEWTAETGGTPDPRWIQVADKLAAPAVADGVFPAHENCPETFTTAPFNTDHPSQTAMLGFLPGDGVDRAVMSATLDRVLSDWDIPSVWGWDFPMMAMTAARLGRREDAVNLLLMDSPKNTCMPSGHNRQGDKADLPLYLPGNGALLLAAAMMAAGWDGAEGYAPGFPEGFVTRHEGLSRYI